MNDGSEKNDPRMKKNDNKPTSVVNLLFGVSKGDVATVRRSALSQGIQPVKIRLLLPSYDEEINISNLFLFRFPFASRVLLCLWFSSIAIIIVHSTESFV